MEQAGYGVGQQRPRLRVRRHRRLGPVATGITAVLVVDAVVVLLNALLH